MRFAAPAAALSLLLLTVSSVSYSKRKADKDVDPQSRALTISADKDVAMGNLDPAIDKYETALLIDPRNNGAYIGLANVARKQELPGKAIKLYREALAIDPNDLAALAGQGEALVNKGAVTKAKENLARIDRICAGNNCPEKVKLASVIAKGAPAPKPVTAEAVTPKPVVATETPAPTKP